LDGKNNISFFLIYQCAIRVAQDDKDGGRLGGSKKKMKRYQRMFSSSFKTVKVDSIIDGRIPINYSNAIRPVHFHEKI
jgi:hypothetical protein